MTDIEKYLLKVKTERYAKNVRQAIHDAIYQCYYDSKVGALDFVARQQIANIISHNNSTDGNSELVDLRAGANGVIYESAGEAVRQQIAELSEAVTAILMDDSKDFSSVVFDNETRLLHFYDENGDDVYDPILIEGGGGGGGSGGGSSYEYSIAVKNLLESRVIVTTKDTPVVLKFNYSSVDEEGYDDGSGIGTILVDGSRKTTFTVKQGDNEIDITQYLASGSNTVKVRVENSEGLSKSISYTVTVAAMTLTSAFDVSSPFTGEILFVYTPTGIGDKTVHILLDGEEIETTVVSYSGRQQTYTIPPQSHGEHIIECYFESTVENQVVPSNRLRYAIICLEEGNNTPIIAVAFNQTEADQYDNIVITGRVYTPNSFTSNVIFSANDVEVSNLTVDRTEQAWTYRPANVGELTLKLATGDIYKTFDLTIAESNINVEAEVSNLALYLSSNGRSNNEENPGVWESGDIACDFQNFNFVSDGWKLDEDNNTVLRVSGDARLGIPYNMFAKDFRTTGKTIEFEIATREVLNYDAEVINCFSGGRGFSITAQQLKLASEQSQLGTRYKEDEHIRVTFVVEKKSENRLLLCYINGIMSGAAQYPEDDDFSQGNPVGITVGSNYCTTDLYNIRIYDNDLTRFQVLDNWIADTQDGKDKLDRFLRNDIYDDYGRVVISQLPNDLCYMVIQCAELPQFKDDKKKCSGYFVDLVNPKRSFVFENAEIDVQGTSSQYYYVKNFKIKFKGGFIHSDGSTTTVYQMNDDAVPVSTFTMKADVASSEGAFNVVLAMIYNDLCPFKTPAQEADSRVRQTIEGFPMVMFWDNGTETKFIGKYNFNNDKGTAEVFGFKSGDESWEILQNGTDRVGWHSADFSGDGWKTDFEARYPDKNTNIARLQALAEWLVSTDTAQATGETIEAVTYDGVEYTSDTAEYRLAKFSAELSDHFVEEAIIYYYLFTDVFLCIDQREKNAFPTYIKDLDRWIVLFYDADSSIGTDNKGNLTFDYWLEDIDYTEAGDPIFNGQNSVLWKNLRQTRSAEITKMYQDMRTAGTLNYDSIIGKFEAHQSKWPEAIFNEDMYRKCLEPLIEDGDGLYIPMLQGKKEQWMKWWLYNRFRYMDSKHVTGSSMENRITIRAHQKANIFLTAYANIVGHVYFNAAMVEHRMERNKEYEFEWPASGAEDPVIGINDADLLTSLGDLSPHMVELIDVSGAPHITSLKLGDNADGYVNYNMNSITLGNNILLRTLDLRNCVNLTQSVDASGCTNIEEIYCEGTSVTSVSVPNGGILKKLHLPATITNLTIRNQTALTDFAIAGYNNVTTLRVENTPAVPALEILNSMPANSRVRIIGFNIANTTVAEVHALCDRLDTMRGLDEGGNNVDQAQVSGTVYIPSLTSKELYEIQSRYPGITVIYSELITYTVRFWNGDTLLQTVENVAYSMPAFYTGDTPLKDGESDHSRWAFAGWSPAPDAVTGDMDCYAAFAFAGSFARELVQRTLAGTYENDRVTTVGDYAFYGTSLDTVVMPNVEFLGISAFESNKSLTSVDMPKLTMLGVTAQDKNHFYGCSSLRHINMPMLVTVAIGMFKGSALTEVVLPKATTVEEMSFQDCKSLRVVDLPVATYIDWGAFKTTALEVLILRTESSVCQLTQISALEATPVASGTGYIYVPSALVDSYKAATNWSTYAAQIRAIEDYPEICGGEV